MIDHRKPEPRNLGVGLHEIQRLQDERLAQWQANTLPVKLPASLQAAKDAAKPTCGDCKHYTRVEFLRPLGYVGDCRPGKMPMWAWPANRRWEDCQAAPCACFERKDTP